MLVLELALTFPASSNLAWGGVLAPAGTPAAVIAAVHSQLPKILAMPDVRERLSKLGADVVASTPEEFSTCLHSEIIKWSKGKAAGVAD
jgi:tripartite-type tricarboxylate transporter receptor subunit TctC